MKKIWLAISVCLFLTININAQKAAKINTDTVYKFTDVDKKPEFPGGEAELYKFIGKNLRYPSSMSEMDVQSKVYVKFIVEKDGSISNIEILKKLYSDLDKEAIRVISIMPKWTPAEKDGKIVRCYFILPINICLQ